MKLSFCAALFTASLAVLMATKADPKVGGPPPLLKATTLLQAPAGANLDSETLNGKVVVLEFWATWCGPCVLAIPHLNELADKFKDKPVQFVAITSEDEATVKAFLAKKPIKAWVALDADKAMKTAYAVGPIPHTVVLGKDGLIAATTFPSAVTEHFIDDLLAGKSAPTKTKNGGLGPEWKSVSRPSQEAAPLFEVSVRPSAPGSKKGSSSGRGSLRYSGYTVLELLPEAFEGATSARVWTNTPLPEGKYDLTVRQPRGHTVREAHELLWRALQAAFDLTETNTTKETEVLVLRIKRTNASGLTPASTKGGAYHTGPGKIEAVNTALEWLVWTLEDKLNKPVIDETGLTKRYDIYLQWDEKTGGANAESLIQAVQEQLGLELVLSTRRVSGFAVGKLGNQQGH